MPVDPSRSTWCYFHETNDDHWLLPECVAEPPVEVCEESLRAAQEFRCGINSPHELHPDDVKVDGEHICTLCFGPVMVKRGRIVVSP